MMNTAVTCKQFCCPKFSTKLVFSIPSFGLNYSLYPSRHTLYQVLTYFLWYLLPFYLAMLPKLLYTSRCHFILCQPPFQMPLKMFYGINVCRLRWPLYNSVTMVIEPSLGQFAGVLGVIVLLKNNIIWSFIIKLQRLLQFILQDGAVKLCIHLSFNPSGIFSTFPEHTTPHHHITTPKLQCPLHLSVCQFIPHLLPYPFPSILPNTIDFSLIRPCYPLPIF